MRNMKLYNRSSSNCFQNLIPYFSMIFLMTFRRSMVIALRWTERTYYDRLLIDNRNNLKKTWSVIKVVVNKK